MADAKPCAVPTCPRSAHCRGWCKNHYERWRRYGDVMEHLPLPEQYPTSCEVNGCERTDRITQGLCGTHYMRFLRGGNPGPAHIDPPRPPVDRSAVCDAEDCPDPVEFRQWCLFHYRRWIKNGDVAERMPKRGVNLDGQCRIESCRTPAEPGTWCEPHYQAWATESGIPLRPQSRPETCIIELCPHQARAYGWCGSHLGRWRRYYSVMADIPTRHARTKGGPCIRPGCEREKLARDLCRRHYAQYRKGGGQIGIRPAPTPKQLEEMLDLQRARDRHQSAARYATNPERYRSANTAWRKANPHRVKLSDQKKRVMRNGAPRIAYTAEQLAAKYAYWGDRCWMCGGPNENLEHVKPLSKGGWDCLSNIRPSCDPCNSRKWATWPFPRMTYGFMRAA